MTLKKMNHQKRQLILKYTIYEYNYASTFDLFECIDKKNYQHEHKMIIRE